MTAVLTSADVDHASLPLRLPHHVASLDGLRMIAVFGVMAVHAGAPGCDLGWIGVDIFFVLSGFLITTLLVREHAQRGSISLWRFWCRRALRLMPAYWLYVGAITVMLLAGVGWHANHGAWTPGSYLGSLWAYFVNYAPMGGIWQHQMLTIHLWSLAVEEQFYLLWPALCWLLLLTLCLRKASLLSWVIVLGIIVYRHFAADGLLDHLLQTRGLGIVMGCAAAMTCASGGILRKVAESGKLRTLTALVALIAVGRLTVLLAHGRIDKPFVHRYGVPPLDVLFTLLIAMLWYGPPDALTRALAWRPVAYMGKISYGLYLYHMAAHELVWGPLLGRIEHWPKVPKFGLRVTVFFAISIFIASVSYHLVEKPFLRLKERVR